MKRIRNKEASKYDRFCESKECLRAFILKYFGEENVREYCNNCSNCLNSDELRDYTIEAQRYYLVYIELESVVELQFLLIYLEEWLVLR